MSKFNIKNGPFIKNKNTTTNIMCNFLIGLIPFIIFATIKNGIYPSIKGYGNLYLVFKPLICSIVSILTGIITEYIFYYLKGNKKSFYNLFFEEYALVPSLLLSLIIPFNTPLYILIIASIITSLSKVLMGGFGKTKINPALIGSLFITLVLGTSLKLYLNPYEVDMINLSHNISLSNLLLGMSYGNIGETSNIICIIVFIYLVLTKIIKWRISISYVVSVIIISSLICLINRIDIYFIINNVLTGGLLFGAIFLAADPITTPITNKGQVISGILLGIMTIIFRYVFHFSEGVHLAVIILNILTIPINYLSIKFYNKKVFANIVLSVVVLLGILSSLLISKII